MQRHFDEQIQELLEKLVLMGRLAESMIQTALRALIERDESLCAETCRKEEEVNRRLLEADNRRKTQELEDARALQLSMLPRLGGPRKGNARSMGRG